MTKKLYSFDDHPEHKAQLEPYRDKWIANALRCTPQTEDEKARYRVAMDGLYRAADLEPPTRGVFVASPLTGAIAWSIASGVWWARANRNVSEADLAASAFEACRRSALRGATPDTTAPGTDSETIRKALVKAVSEATGCIEGNGGVVPEMVQLFRECLRYWWKGRNGGNMWSGWPCYLSFFKDVAKFDLPIYDKYQHYEQAAILGGPRFMHDKFWIVSDFPVTKVGRDASGGAHCENGPQLKWADGWATYFWHNVRMPAWAILHPEQITLEKIDAETNAEERRVLIERYGQGRYASENSEVVHEDTDSLGKRRRLLRRPVEGDDPVMVVEVRNATPSPDGSFKIYYLPVHHELRPLPINPGEELGDPQKLTCHNAVASTFGLRGEKFKVAVES